MNFKNLIQYILPIIVFISGSSYGSMNDPQVLGGAIHHEKNGDFFVRPGVTCLQIDDFISGTYDGGSHDIEYIPIRESRLEVTSGLSHEEMVRNITSNISVNSTINAVNPDILKASLNFIHNTTDLNTALVFNYKITYLGGHLVLVKPKFTDEALNLLKTDATQFESYCGQKFVNQFILGAEAYISIRFDFASVSKKLEISPQINTLDFKDLVKLSDTLKITREEDRKNIKLSISGWQKGGDAADIVGIFGGSIAECTLTNISSCQSILSNAISYINSDFGAPLKEYAFNFTSGRVVRLPDTAYILNYTGLPYCDYMKFPKNEEGGKDYWEAACTPTVADETIASSLHELKTLEEQVGKEFEKIAHIPSEIGAIIHPSYEKLLKEYQRDMEYNLKLLKDAKSDCRISKRTCHITKNRVQKSLLPFKPELLEKLKKEERINICFDSGAKADMSQLILRLSEKGKNLGQVNLNEIPRRDSKDCFLYHVPGMGEFNFDELDIRVGTKVIESDKCRKRKDSNFSSLIDWDLNSISVTHLRTNHQVSFIGKRFKKGHTCKSLEKALVFLPWENLEQE